MGDRKEISKSKETKRGENMQVVMMAMLISVVASSITAYVMMHIFINRLEKIENVYREKMIDTVSNVVERKIKSV